MPCPVFTCPRFDLGSQVGDVAWAPYSSTVFAAVTIDGKVFVYDLAANKYQPVCAQVGGREQVCTVHTTQVVVSRKTATLNNICFNSREPILVVGGSSCSAVGHYYFTLVRRKL